ncbi:MAG TPA: oxidoreductase [Lactobacillaceae bacterium]
MKDQVWLVTGSSTGFGRKLVEELIAQGIKVVATARKVETLDTLPSTSETKILKLKLDVTNHDDVTNVVSKAINYFGHLDVLVNNAGYGYAGAIEESDENAVREMFETNFWGVSDMTRAVLPYFREQKAGRILNITSIGGLVGVPTFGYYNATKFAVEGFANALSQEVKPLGIQITNVEPGPFRTDWAGRSMTGSVHAIADYETTAHAQREMTNQRSGQQDGSPELAAKAMVKLAQLDEQPLHFVAGINAYERATNALEGTLSEFKKFKADATHLNYGDEDYWQ